MSSRNESLVANGFRPVERTLPVRGPGGILWQAGMADLSGIATRDTIGRTIHWHPRRTGHRNPHRTRP